LKEQLKSEEKKMRNQLLDEYIKEDLIERKDDFLQKCPKCNNYMPNFIANCWYCGQLLDKDLIRLVEEKD